MPTPPVIIITGASSGIGAATARLFGEDGFRVVLAARRTDRIDAIAKEICQAGGEALAIPCDIREKSDIYNLSQKVITNYGQVDILFNNAGFGRLDWLENLDPVEDVQDQIQVNLVGMILLTQAVLPVMMERRSGHIINMDSVAGYIAPPTYSIYSASKFGVRGFSEALRREVGIYGIHVSVIYPGAVETEFRDIARIRRRTGIKTPTSLRLSAEDVAVVIKRLSKKPRRSYIIPWYFKSAVLLNKIAPGLVDWFIERRFVRLERENGH